MTCFTVCVVFRWSRPRGTGVLPGWLQCWFYQGKDRGKSPWQPPAHIFVKCEQRGLFKHKTPFRDLWTRGRWEPVCPQRSLNAWCDPSPLNTIGQTHTYTFFHCIVNVNFGISVIWSSSTLLYRKLLQRMSTDMTARNNTCTHTHKRYIPLTQAHTHWQIAVTWPTLTNRIYSRKECWS